MCELSSPHFYPVFGVGFEQTACILFIPISFNFILRLENSRTDYLVKPSHSIDQNFYY